MSEKQTPRRRTREQPIVPGAHDDRREHSALVDRWQAVRRWIEDDDDAACRGID
jgi:hypothetical protein